MWPETKVKTRWGQYPDNIYRVIGPNTVWAAETNDQYKIGPWEPDSYLPFVTRLPQAGNQLFDSHNTNFSGWKNLEATDIPSPSDTGYVKALHNAATPDKHGKYGFFCYPKDNAAGEFTWVPTSVKCKVTVYSFEK